MVLKKTGGLGAQLRKLPRGPDLSELHQLLSQCMEQRGRTVKLAWRGANLTPFTLEVVCSLKSSQPQWKLFSDQSKTPLFDYTSVDVLLVYNLVVSNCAEITQSTKPADVSASQQRMPAMQSPAAPAPPPAAEPKPAKYEDDPVTSHLPRPRVPERQPPPNFGDDPGPLANSADRGSYIPSFASESEPPLFVQPGSPGSIQSSTTVPTPGFAPVPNPAILPAAEGIPREGTIESGSMGDLLREILKAGVTGRLDVRCDDLAATVFIQDGIPIDATAGDVVGDEAMIEMLTWKDGNFSFEPRILRNNHTVYESIESLLEQSKQLAERIAFLKNAGMLPGSTLLPVSTMLSQHDFMGRVSDNCPCDIDTISRVYCSLDGKRTFEELCRFLHISRIQLVHIVFHLLTRELIKIVNQAKPKSALTLAPKVIDNAAIQSIMMSLRRADTGLFIYPAFLYFLEQEYFRSYRSRASFSVVVFELRQKKIIDGEVAKRVLSERALMDAVLRISKIKRHVDLISHYDSFDYALLLPSTRAQGAEIFVGRIIEALRDRPLGGEVMANQLALAFGVASIPEDFKDMASLLGAADLAMAQARTTEQPLVMYRDIRHLVG